MNFVHILWSRNTPRPWWRADQRLDVASDYKVFTDCCACRVPAIDAQARLWDLEIPHGGMGDYQEKLFEGMQPGFYIPYGDEPRWEIRCAPDSGCNVNPRKKCGADLRFMTHNPY